MKTTLTLATLILTAGVASADDVRWIFTDAQEARIKSIVDDRIRAALEAQPTRPQPAAATPPTAAPPVTAAYPAPPGDGWTWAGSNWTRPMPAFATPVRSAAHQMFAPRSACPGGVCPR